MILQLFHLIMVRAEKCFTLSLQNLRRFYQRQNLQGTHKSGYPLARYRGHSMRA